MKGCRFRRHLIVLLIAATVGTFLINSTAVAPVSANVDKAISQNLIASDQKNQILEQYGKLPLIFIENKGQMHEEVRFYEKGPNRSVFFTPQEIVWLMGDGRQDGGLETSSGIHLPSLAGGKASGAASSATIVRMKPIGMNQNVEILPGDVQVGKVNYCIGRDPEKWFKNISTYGSIIYKNAYPNIDLKFYGNNQRLEYDIM